MPTEPRWAIQQPTREGPINVYSLLNSRTAFYDCTKFTKYLGMGTGFNSVNILSHGFTNFSNTAGKAARNFLTDCSLLSTWERIWKIILKFNDNKWWKWWTDAQGVGPLKINKVTWRWNGLIETIHEHQSKLLGWWLNKSSHISSSGIISSYFRRVDEY